MSNQNASVKHPELYQKTEDQVKYINLIRNIDAEVVEELTKLLPTFSYNKVS